MPYGKTPYRGKAVESGRHDFLREELHEAYYSITVFYINTPRLPQWQPLETPNYLVDTKQSSNPLVQAKLGEHTQQSCSR